VATRLVICSGDSNAEFRPPLGENEASPECSFAARSGAPRANTAAFPQQRLRRLHAGHEGHHAHVRDLVAGEAVVFRPAPQHFADEIRPGRSARASMYDRKTRGTL